MLVLAQMIVGILADCESRAQISCSLVVVVFKEFEVIVAAEHTQV